MIPVQMEGVTPQAAYRAALSSLLDISLEYIPEYTGLAAQMQWNAWLGATLNLSANLFADLSRVPPGLWLLQMHSQYPGYDVHTVVMAAMNLAHDPHPEPQDLDFSKGFQGQVLVPLDPSEPSGRFALAES